MALARNFEDVTFLKKLGEDGGYEDGLQTRGRIIGLTVDEQVSMGLTWKEDIVRLRVTGTRDVRELPMDFTSSVRVGTKFYEISRSIGDVKPGFIDFYLTGKKQQQDD